MVFRNDFFALADIGWPKGSADEHGVTPNDWAGVTLAFQRDFPKDVLLCWTAPGQRQICAAAVAKSRRAAELGPVPGLANEHLNEQREEKSMEAHCLAAGLVFAGGGELASLSAEELLVGGVSTPSAASASRAL